MNTHSRNWPDLCRRYRLLRGLKQEAMAQDFRVNQSTVSRWEQGRREPSMAAKRTILEALSVQKATLPKQTMQMMLELSNSAVAIWDRNAILRGASKRFLTAKMLGKPQKATLIGQNAVEVFGNQKVWNLILDCLTSLKFFQGEVVVANFAFAPFVNPVRQFLGGVSSVSTFPVDLGSGDIGILSIYNHDVLGDAPLHANTISVDWVHVKDGREGQLLLVRDAT